MGPPQHNEGALSPPSELQSIPTEAVSTTPSAETSKSNGRYELTDQTRYVSPGKIIMVCQDQFML